MAIEVSIKSAILDTKEKNGTLSAPSDAGREHRHGGRSGAWQLYRIAACNKVSVFRPISQNLTLKLISVSIGDGGKKAR
jgi:hypothetical protein